MCAPAAVPYLLAASTAISAYGQIQQGKAAAEQGKYNAAISENKAKDAQNRGRVEENKQRRITAARMGQQRAQFAANGVELDNGSASDILADTAELGEQDALTIRGNSLNEANAFRSQAQMQRAQGQQAKRNSYFGAAGTLLSGASKVSSVWSPKKTG